MRRVLMLIGLLASALAGASATAATVDSPWVEGQHYFVVEPAQPTRAPKGKVEVVEVFSYACPACFQFYPTIDKLKAALPAAAQLRYVAASWHPEEDWKNFQRGFFTAESMGLVERTHDAVFDAIWKSGTLAIMDPVERRPKAQMPTIVDIAAFYAQATGTSQADFLATAHSFAVDAAMRGADEQIKAYQADQTPTLIINGKYRLTPTSAGNPDDFVKLAYWLVSRELTRH